MLSLPLLESFTRAESQVSTPKRIIAVCTDLGVIPEYFYPSTSGTDFELTDYLQPLSRYRDKFTVFSGLSHPEVVGGHQTDKCFLTGAPHPRKPGFRNSISLDQYAASRLGPVTRFPTLSLRVGPGGGSLSYSADGVRIPAEESPTKVYRDLFVQGSKEDVERQVKMLREGQSLMDGMSANARRLQNQVSRSDAQRLEQFFSSFREMERRLHEAEEWEQKPKPSVTEKEPKDDRSPELLIQRTRNMYEMARLAVETDSTRLVTIFVTQQFNPKVDLPGVDLPHHALTHQQSQKGPREQLKKVELAQMNELARLVRRMQATTEVGNELLDSTMLLYGSNLSNAGKHDTTNLPILLLGGGLRHGQHVTYDKQRNLPLSNLFVTMLQRLGVETDRFSSSSSRLSELDS